MQLIPEFFKHRRRWSAALAGIMLLSLVNLAGAATVQGRLIFKNNAPASDVAVRLTAGPKVITPFSYSARDGRFALKNVPAGTYTLEVWRNRVLVKSLSRTVVVREPAFDAKDITLP